MGNALKWATDDVLGIDSGGDDAATQMRREEEERQKRIRQGTNKISNIFDSQFNDEFFDARQQAYLDYAMPQLNDQYGQAQEDLTFHLARSGLTNSSVRGQQLAELEKQFGTLSQQVGDQALADANSVRTGVEDARAQLISSLNATGDTQAAVSGALARADALSQPQAYSPLTQLFANFSSNLEKKAGAAKAGAYTNGSASLFSAPNNSVVVTGG